MYVTGEQEEKGQARKERKKQNVELRLGLNDLCSQDTQLRHFQCTRMQNQHEHRRARGGDLLKLAEDLFVYREKANNVGSVFHRLRLH